MCPKTDIITVTVIENKEYSSSEFLDEAVRNFNFCAGTTNCYKYTCQVTEAWEHVINHFLFLLQDYQREIALRNLLS